MSSLKCVLSICTQNFRKWRTDYRIWCIAVFLIIMTLVYVDDMRKVCDYMGTPMPMWIFPFMYSQFFTKLVFTFPVVLLFCNAPFIDANQTFVFMRSGKMKWLIAQIIYIFAASAAYYVFLLILSLLTTVFTGEKTLEWGSSLLALSNGDCVTIVNDAGAPFVSVRYIITEFFTPLQAVGFTFLMSWLGASFLGLLIFFFNTVTGIRSTGLIVSSFFIVISSVIYNEMMHGSKFLRFSPISWITLDNIDVGGLTKNPSFEYCVTVYVITLISLIAAILIFGRKKSLDIKE